MLEFGQKFFENRAFCGLLIAIPLKMYPNVKIGWKMANNWLLFPALTVHLMWVDNVNLNRLQSYVRTYILHSLT